MPGTVTGWPRRILLLEGLAILAVSTFLYAETGSGWALFAILLLAPDVAFLAYLAGPKIGAIGYNALHTCVAPALLYAAAVILDQSALTPFALIWSAHIGMDRMLGYGLKYATGFGATHLGVKRPG